MSARHVDKISISVDKISISGIGDQHSGTPTTICPEKCFCHRFPSISEGSASSPVSKARFYFALCLLFWLHRGRQCDTAPVQYIGPTEGGPTLWKLPGQHLLKTAMRHDARSLT